MHHGIGGAGRGPDHVEDVGVPAAPDSIIALFDRLTAHVEPEHGLEGVGLDGSGQGHVQDQVLGLTLEQIDWSSMPLIMAKALVEEVPAGRKVSLSVEREMLREYSLKA